MSFFPFDISRFGESSCNLVCRETFSFTEWEKEKKARAGGENLMPMEVDGIVGELFSYFFFIISLFLMILIKLL